MNQFSSKIAGASVLASLLSPLTMMACSAKDLTEAELANMAQASAVRMGCGVSVGVDIAGIATSTTALGVFMASALVAVAVSFLPKQLRATCWRFIDKAGLIYYWVGLPAAITAGITLGFTAAIFALAVWLVSSIIAVPKILNWTWKTGHRIAYLAQQAIKRFNSLYVRVDGNTVTLTKGLQSKTRVVEATNQIAEEQESAEAEICLKP